MQLSYDGRDPIHWEEMISEFVYAILTWLFTDNALISLCSLINSSISVSPVICFCALMVISFLAGFQPAPSADIDNSPVESLETVALRLVHALLKYPLTHEFARRKGANRFAGGLLLSKLPSPMYSLRHGMNPLISLPSESTESSILGMVTSIPLTKAASETLTGFLIPNPFFAFGLWYLLMTRSSCDLMLTPIAVLVTLWSATLNLSRYG